MSGITKRTLQIYEILNEGDTLRTDSVNPVNDLGHLRTVRLGHKEIPSRREEGRRTIEDRTGPRKTGHLGKNTDVQSSVLEGLQG